ALLDAELLAEVYIELIGGRQASLVLGDTVEGTPLAIAARSEIEIAPRAEPRLFRVTTAEMEAHRLRIGKLGANALWLEYMARATPVTVVDPILAIPAAIQAPPGQAALPGTA